MIQSLISSYTFVKSIFMRSTFVRYVFSGGAAAAIDVALLYFLVEFWGVYYLAAATFAMTVSFIIRFLLQKYVTFQNEDEAHAKKQFALYSALYVASLFATNALLYLFVEKLRLWILPAQILAILLVASGCFFIYRLFIFAAPNPARKL